MGGPADPTSADLVTLQGADLEQAYSELTTRYRGYGETPTLESALAELDALVGLEPVKRQVREIAAQLRVARLRDAHGLASQPPARHFVFTGPPGTGKTTVARILGRIFAALGLLVRPSVVEAHRADLVGEHLPRSRPISWSTRPWAASCSWTRPTHCTMTVTRAATRLAPRPWRRC
jgi:Mrp family chromosome partitioning ATPase